MPLMKYTRRSVRVFVPNLVRLARLGGSGRMALTWPLTMLDMLTRMVAVALFTDEEALPCRGCSSSTYGSIAVEG